MSKLDSIVSSCRRISLLAAVALLGGCALAQQKKLFPDFYATPELPTRIDLLVDVTVLADLPGDDLGVDLERNRATAEHALERVDATLRYAGYQPNLVRSGHGLALFQGPQQFYVVEDGVVAGTPYRGVQESADDPWTANEARNFVYMLMRTARTRRTRPEGVASHEEYAALAHMPVPKAFARLQTSHLLVMNVVVYDAAAAKEAASTLATLAVPLAIASAGGSLLLVPVFRDSYTHVEFALLDTETREIAWSAYYTDFDDGPRNLEITLQAAISTFPAHAERKTRYPSAPRR